MSQPRAALQSLVAGRLPADYGLLQNARLEGLGTQAFGQEAIVAAFRRAPLSLDERTDVLENPRILAAFLDDGTVIFADIFNGRIARLWILGEQAIPAVPVHAVSVPFDPDLSQARDVGGFSPSDHPDLLPAHAPCVRAILHDLAAGQVEQLDEVAPNRDLPQAFRMRAFVRRAFSVERRAAVLLAVSLWSDDARRVIAHFGVAVRFRPVGNGASDRRLVVDRAGARASLAAQWTPRV